MCSASGSTAPRRARPALARSSTTCSNGGVVKHIEWGFLIVNYLFLGGLSAGLYFLAALSTLLQREGDAKFGNIARRGAWLAPWPVMIGTALLIFDLGKWYRFYKLMLHFRWTSPMSKI